VSDITRSNANTDPQLLTEGGPIMLRDFNPRGLLRFSGRKCVTCGDEIMNHWLRHSDDPDIRAEYWCSKEGNQFSQGITDCQYDVPEGFGK